MRSKIGIMRLSIQGSGSGRGGFATRQLSGLSLRGARSTAAFDQRERVIDVAVMRLVLAHRQNELAQAGVVGQAPAP
ncbi:MAG: hypothetical protein ABJD97_20430 [Betaproteobacteria bacterium]